MVLNGCERFQDGTSSEIPIWERSRSYELHGCSDTWNQKTTPTTRMDNSVWCQVGSYNIQKDKRYQRECWKVDRETHYACCLQVYEDESTKRYRKTEKINQIYKALSKAGRIQCKFLPIRCKKYEGGIHKEGFIRDGGEHRSETKNNNSISILPGERICREQIPSEMVGHKFTLLQRKQGSIDTSNKTQSIHSTHNREYLVKQGKTQKCLGQSVQGCKKGLRKTRSKRKSKVLETKKGLSKIKII